MCKYCEGREAILYNYPADLSKIIIKDGEILFLNFMENRINYTRINYCPMCGRKLGVEYAYYGKAKRNLL